MDPLLLLAIGFAMGFGGGLVGIGGSMIMIPMMVLCFGENQHLYQAVAMICNVFVGASALVAHIRAKSIVPSILGWLVPAAVVGVIGGVTASNFSVFSGANSYLLARILGCYLVYVVIYNLFKFHRAIKGVDDERIDVEHSHITPVKSVVCGICAGMASGLMGIGAGAVTTPLQQMLMKVPLRRAMSNAAATIVVMGVFGATYKNATLAKHGIEVAQSLKTAVFIIPTAMAGGYLGGYLMHKLPQNFVRAMFVIVMSLAAFKLLTVQGAG